VISGQQPALISFQQSAFSKDRFLLRRNCFTGVCSRLLKMKWPGTRGLAAESKREKECVKIVIDLQAFQKASAWFAIGGST
jgi:hypothetical protein